MLFGGKVLFGGKELFLPLFLCIAYFNILLEFSYLHPHKKYFALIPVNSFLLNQLQSLFDSFKKFEFFFKQGKRPVYALVVYWACVVNLQISKLVVKLLQVMSV